MLNVGTGELFLILLVALLIFGPNKLPEMARTFGRALRSFQEEGRKAAETLKSAVEDVPSKVGVVDRPDAPDPAAADPEPAPDAAAGSEQAPSGNGALAEPSPTGTGRVERPEQPEPPPEPPMDREQRLLEDT